MIYTAGKILWTSIYRCAERVSFTAHRSLYISLMRILYYSAMTVSPGSGGGNTIFNLLEPSPADVQVFYATPNSHPPHWAPFPELTSRLCRFENDRPFSIRGGRYIRAVRRINKFIDRMTERKQQNVVIDQLMAYVGELKIDALLISPQTTLDLRVGTQLTKISGLPAVVWFMDDYYSDNSSASYVDQLWKIARRRFVISEAMQEYFQRLYGLDCDVLNNSITFPDFSPQDSRPENAPLRIAYTGATHSYYLDTILSVSKELEGLRDQVSFDIYSHESIPPNSHAEGGPFRHFRAPIPASELNARLRSYDILLMLTSFKDEHRAIAETSLASKWADYLASGRCILVYGPEYSENVQYARRYGIGETVTSNAAGALRHAVLSLSENEGRRCELGERAYRFGLQRHEKSVNSKRLWDAMFEAFAGEELRAVTS